MADAFITGITDRVKNILTKPAAEWDRIEAEKTTIPDLYKNYAAILAVLPAIAVFVKMSVFGSSTVIDHSIAATSVRHYIGLNVLAMIGNYIIGLIGVGVLAIVVDFLAPKFGGVSNQINAFKLSIYSMTAAWLAGACLVIPVVGGLLSLAGLYSLYLFYLGVPKLMKCPQSNAAIFTVVALVVNAIVMMIITAITH